MPDEEGTAVNDSAVESTDVTESAPVEETDSHADEVSEDTSTDETDSQETDTSDTEATDDETTSETDETETEDKPQSKGERRKEQLNTEIRDLVAERNAIRQEVEKLNASVYRPASVDELLQQENPETGEYYNRLEAQLESMRQEREVEKYNQRVSDSLVTLESEVQNVLREFPMFDPQSTEYNKEVAKAAAGILNDSLIYDPYTRQVVGTRISPYKLYKSHAAAAKLSAAKAETKAQKNVETMLKNADPTPGRKGTPVAFDKMSLKQQEAYLRKKGHDV